MNEANVGQIELRVQNLDCEHDAAAIERGLAGFPGLLALQVYPKSAKVAMSFDPADTSAEALKEKLESLGFPERHWPRLVNATEEVIRIDTLLTTRQLQGLLQVDRITIYRMLKDGRLQGFKVGGQWRFSRQDIDRWLQAQRADLDVPESPQTAAELQPSPEALPLFCIRAIQDIFAQALGVGAVTTSVDGTPLGPVAHSCEFCDLILGTETGRQRCIGSWRAAATVGDTPRLATCHAGLRCVSSQIKVQGEFVAATHAGQFLDAPPSGEAWRARVAELATATGVNEQELSQALARVAVLDEVQQQQVSRLLHRAAATFSEIGEERLNLLGRLRRIAEMAGVALENP